MDFLRVHLHPDQSRNPVFWLVADSPPEWPGMSPRPHDPSHCSGASNTRTINACYMCDSSLSGVPNASVRQLTSLAHYLGPGAFNSSRVKENRSCRQVLFEVFKVECAELPLDGHNAGSDLFHRKPGNEIFAASHRVFPESAQFRRGRWRTFTGQGIDLRPGVVQAGGVCQQHIRVHAGVLS